jgi:putative transposase
MVLDALGKALQVAKPIIWGSDQGSQFTSNEYAEFLQSKGIRISMDGKSRWADNIMIERWFRSLKCEEVYLTKYANIREARKAIGAYIHDYNFNRLHSSLGYRTPGECYYPMQLMEYVA